MFDLHGKVAIVTGGNGGIGLGMARGLASAGATVVIAARNLEKSRAAVAELKARGGAASGSICGQARHHQFTGQPGIHSGVTGSARKRPFLRRS